MGEHSLQVAKADGFSSALQVVAGLKNGQTSDPVAYTSQPLYRAFTFVGKAGDAIEAYVRSADGDAVAWLLDKSFNVITKADDSDGTTDAHLSATLTNPTSDTFYLVFREFSDHAATFRVTLKGSSDVVAERSLIRVTVGPFDPSSAVVTNGLDQTNPVGFVATGTYSDGSTQDLTTTATWSSTDLGVVSFGGLLTSPHVFHWIWGVSPGTATLVATAALPSTTIALSGVVTLTVH